MNNQKIQSAHDTVASSPSPHPSGERAGERGFEPDKNLSSSPRPSPPDGRRGSEAPQSKLATRNFWPLGIFTAFGLFFAGMATVIVIASTHRDHLVNASYYEQELKFQTQIDSTDRTRKSGATVAYDAANGSVVIALPVAQLAQKFSGTIELYRPSEPKLDREFLLEPKTDGTQMLNVSKLATGLWLVRVKWNADGENYFLEQKITVAGK